MFHNILLIVVATVNCMAFIIYGVDKIKAINNEWRVSEKRLLRISMIGPFGSYLGMKLFRHKVKKTRFYVGIPIFILIHIIILTIIVSLT